MEKAGKAEGQASGFVLEIAIDGILIAAGYRLTFYLYDRQSFFSPRNPPGLGFRSLRRMIAASPHSLKPWSSQNL